MKDRTKDKIEEIESYLEELSEILPSSLEKYKEDFKTKAACERYAEKIVEAVTDLAFLLIKERSLSLPEEDLQAFEVLTESKIISQELKDKLQDAKRMRNILAHKYGEINDEIVFNALKDEIEKDIKTFIKCVKDAIK